MSETLGGRLVSRDAARFVGRARELVRLQRMLGERPPAQIAIVSGAAGVGKSALMRELARRAVAEGWTTHVCDARDLTPSGHALEAALGPARASVRPLVVLDSWERMTAFDPLLRSELLPGLPPDLVLLIGTRTRPGSDWFRRGWENIVLDLPLSQLDDADAHELLRAREVSDPAERRALVEWAGGSPLALVVAADAGTRGAELARGGAPPTVLEEPLRRILDTRPDGEQRDVLAVASLAHVTTPGLLAAALPKIDSERAFAWLRAHPSAEPWRDGVMLHDLLARLIRADLRRRSPELERDLRRRLVDALYTRAMAGGFLDFARDLQHLVQDPAIRWGFAWDVSGRYRVDVPRPGDTEIVAARSSAGGIAWLRSAERYFSDAPERVCVVRDRTDEVCGYGITMTPANAPAFAYEDPLLGPRLWDARERFPDAAAVVCRQAVDLTRSSSPVIALIGMAGVLTSGLHNPAGAYLPIVADDHAGQAFSHAVGATVIPDLAAELDGVQVECHLLDHGPGGLIAFQRAAVYRELGLSPPQPEPPITLEAVRDALRAYDSRGATPMGPPSAGGGEHGARAASLRARIDAAVECAFGHSEQERRLRQVLIRAYIDPAPTHEQAASELHLSRSAYFRQLRAAVERIAAQLGASSARSKTAVEPIRDPAGTDMLARHS